MLHLTAKTRDGSATFADIHLAGWVWRHLRVSWPDALAVVLMGNHLHLIVARDDPELERHRLNGLLGPLCHRFGHRFEPVPAPRRLGSPTKIRTELAYVWLNPCRARMADDPLRWLWSTYRDLFGAVPDPWVTGDRVAKAVADPTWRDVDALHGFVSGDKHVHPGGTPPPGPYVPPDLVEVPLLHVLEAALAATRATPEQLWRKGPSRRAFLLLARDQGWDRAPVLAEVCRTSPSTVWRTWRTAREGDQKLLRAARTCLIDERLRRPRAPSPRKVWSPGRALGLQGK